MTQAFNLAQLANNLNTSGQLDATDGLSGLVANANLASSGSASSTTYLRGDRTWGTVTQKILQVTKSAIKTNTFSTTSGTYVDVTGLSATITPSSSSSTVLVMVDLGSLVGDNTGVWARLTRNGTEVFSGDTTPALHQIYPGGSTNGDHYYGAWHHVSNFVDTPATTSAVTYQVQIRGASAGNACYIGRNIQNAGTYGGRTAAQIILMEISA